VIINSLTVYSECICNMGWMKIVVISAVGVYSFRSVTRVNQLVKQVNVPRHSLLDKYSPKSKEYKDAYKIELPARFKLLKNTGSVNELYVHDLARNFFTSKIFQNLERPILLGSLSVLTKGSYTADDSVLNYGAFKFKKNDSILLWKVINRENNEILMKWEVGSVSGTSWFCIPKDENALLFGSSFMLPKAETDKEEIYRKKSEQLYIDAARTLPEEVPLGLRLKNLFVNMLLQTSIPVHKLYSKYLLLSTYNKIVNEEKERREPKLPY